MRTRILRGSVDDLAETLLLFGKEPLLETGPGLAPAMHLLLDVSPDDLMPKIVLLRMAGIPIDQQDEIGETLLHRVCAIASNSFDPQRAERKIRLLRLLLANGADPNLRDHQGRSARTMSIASGNPRLSAAFRPDNIALDIADAGPEGLRQVATQQKWQCVLSLLDEVSQAMEVDDDSASVCEGRQADFNASELFAAAALMELDRSDAQ